MCRVVRWYQSIIIKKSFNFPPGRFFGHPFKGELFFGNLFSGDLSSGDFFPETFFSRITADHSLNMESMNLYRYRASVKTVLILTLTFYSTY